MKEKFSKIVLNEVIMDSMPGLAYIYTKDGHLVAWGKNASKVIGYSDDELKNKLFLDFIDPADHEKTIKAFQNVFVTREYDQIEYKLVTKSGKRIPYLGTGAPAVIDGEEYLIGTALDISELDLAREKIKEQVEEISKLYELLKEENIYLKDQLNKSDHYSEIIGESEQLKYILYKVDQVAPTDATVLIQGETGTGKELVARAIHKRSKRNNDPFISVNCASIPENLIESELFGHEKGAFTGAVEKRIGRFELANKGTIFLDEIAELPLSVQPKLLRILQKGEFERIGSSKTIKTDARVISATNKNLEQEIANGRFRNDLYFRLNVFPITVIPLRERKSDIPLLVEYYTKFYSKKFNKPINTIPKKILTQLMDYTWPGNVRELENIIERAVITSNSEKLNVETFPINENEIEVTNSLDDLQKNHIVKVLKQTNWKISGVGGAASILHVNPDTLRSKMRKLGIKRT